VGRGTVNEVEREVTDSERPSSLYDAVMKFDKAGGRNGALDTEPYRPCPILVGVCVVVDVLEAVAFVEEIADIVPNVGELRGRIVMRIDKLGGVYVAVEERSPCKGVWCLHTLRKRAVGDVVSLDDDWVICGILFEGDDGVVVERGSPKRGLDSR